MKVIEKYYSISKNVIEKFELLNKESESLKNTKIIKSIQNLKESNANIDKKLNDILKDNILKNQFNSLIDIYINNRNNYTNLDNQLNNTFGKEQGGNNNINSVYINNPQNIIKVKKNN